MENQELKIISDTGEESQFQATTIYPEQFASISEVIQEHYDYFVSKIDNEFTDVYKAFSNESFIFASKLDAYNLKIIDLITYHELKNEKDLRDQKEEIEQAIYTLGNKFPFLDNKFNEASKIQESINAITFEELSAIQKYILSLEEKIDQLKLQEVNILTILRSFREDTKNSIEELKAKPIKKPWYKRIFGKR